LSKDAKEIIDKKYPSLVPETIPPIAPSSLPPIAPSSFQPLPPIAPSSFQPLPPIAPSSFQPLPVVQSKAPVQKAPTEKPKAPVQKAPTEKPKAPTEKPKALAPANLCNISEEQVLAKRKVTKEVLNAVAQKLSIYVSSKMLRGDIIKLVVNKLNTLSVTDPVCIDVMSYL
jgi:hypothetical protein